MFDLNEAINDWKLAFGTKGECSLEDIQELESHLREQIDSLSASGLSEREVFLVSVSRLGTPEEIGEQYAKADPAKIWQHRALWMAGGVLCWFSLISFHKIFTACIDFVAFSLITQNGQDLGAVNLLANVIFLILVALGGRLICRHMAQSRQHSMIAVFTSTPTRIVISILAVLLAGFLGEIVSRLPVSHAFDVLSSENLDLYVTYRFLSENVLFAVFAITVAGFAILLSNRNRVPSKQRVRLF